MRYPEFVGGSYTSQSLVAGAERTLNWYVEQLKRESAGAKTPTALYPTPGAVLFASAPAGVGPGRGLFKFEDRVFAGIGANLYEIFATGTLTDRGLILRDSEPVTFATNGDLNNQIAVVSNGAVYCFDLSTNTLTAIGTLTSGVRSVDYLDGYFLVLLPDTSEIRFSDLGNGLVYNVLNVRPRSLAADRWQAMIVAAADVWALGSLTTDILYNTGVAPVPIAPRPGLKIQWGIEAPRSLALLSGSPIWLAQDVNGGGMVMHADGYNPRRISHHAMEQTIQRYATREDAVGWTYQQDGHTFYVLTFPTEGATWVYDAANAGQWHEREYLDPITGLARAWRPQFHVNAFGKHLVLDSESGDVYELSLSTATDVGGAAIRRSRTAPHVQGGDLGMLFLDELALDIEQGVGTSTGQGVAPVAVLEVSHNGGRTWTRERWADIGAGGDYGRRVRWGRLGSGIDNVFRVTITDPVACRVMGASLQMRRGTDR